MKKLSNEEISIIIEANEKYGGNIAEATRNTAYTSVTIIRYWRKYNFQIGKHGGKKIPLESRLQVH